MFENRGPIFGGLAVTVALFVSAFYYFKPTPKLVQEDAEPVYDYSLKVNGEKIKGYRNPAAQKKYQTVNKEEAPSKRTSSTSSSRARSSSRRHVIKETSPAIINSAPSYPANQEPEFRTEGGASPSNYSEVTSGSDATSSRSSVDNSGTTFFSNTPYPETTTTGSVSNGNQNQKETPPPAPKTPFLKGKVKPLDGIISSCSTDFFIQSAYANVCTNPRILLMDLTEFSILLDNPITAAEIDSSTVFEFDPIQLELDIKNPQRYMLQTLGCEVNYQRIISSFYEVQDLDKITTLVSKVINTKVAGALKDLSSEAIGKLYNHVQTKSSPTVDFEEVYTLIESEDTLKNNFKQTFAGVPPVELTVAAPDINELKIHSILKEKTNYKYEVKAFHWSPGYQIGYEWRVDGELKGSTAVWDYIPSANSKPEQIITLIIGKKNRSDNLIDRSTPYHEIDFDVTVSDIYPPVAPDIALNPLFTNPGNTRSVKFDLNTGAEIDGIYNNCETFESLALVESEELPNDSDFTFNCVAGPIMTLPYNIQNPQDGPVTLKLWARDAAGKISQSPSTINLKIDTSHPVIKYLNLSSAYEADTPATFKWSLTEMNASASQKFKIEFYNGSLWEDLPEVPLTNGPHNEKTFETTFHLPNLLTSNARIRISYADIFGQETIEETDSFSIKKPILSSTPLLLNMGDVQNKQDSAEYILIFTNSGEVSSKVCSAPALSGPQAAEFTIVRDECQGQSIGASGCEVAIKAHPLDVGIRSTNITITCQNDIFTTPIQIESKNNSPVASHINLTTAEDSAVVVNLGDIKDADGDNLTYFITTPPLYGTLDGCVVSGEEYHCTYTPNSNFNGTDYFNFKSYDGKSYSNIGNGTLTVTPVNDAPTLAATQSLSTNEDTALNFNLNSGSDVENSPLNYIVVSPPASGVLSCVGGTDSSCSYTPALNFNGVTTFTYKVNDGELESTLATVTITINPVNDPPVMGLDQILTAIEDTNLPFTLSAATDIDLPAQTISYKLVSLPSKGTLTDCLNDSTYVTDRSCVYVPHGNANGTDTFTYIAHDGVTDAVSVATVTINITPVNDAPTVAATQSVTTAEDTSVTFELNAGNDIENSPLSYVIVSPPAQGTLNCTGGNESILYLHTSPKL